MTRVLGLDHGSRRIGVAIGDTETRMAFARPAVRARSAVAAVQEIANLAAREGAQLVVIGLPYNMDGTEGRQAAAARGFGERLRRIGLQVAFEDERLSSWEAAERLAGGGRAAGRSRSGGELDSAAARVILQQYLDARPSPGRPQETE